MSGCQKSRALRDIPESKWPDYGVTGPTFMDKLLQANVAQEQIDNGVTDPAEIKAKVEAFKNDPSSPSSAKIPIWFNQLQRYAPENRRYLSTQKLQKTRAAWAAYGAEACKELDTEPRTFSPHPPVSKEATCGAAGAAPAAEWAASAATAKAPAAGAPQNMNMTVAQQVAEARIAAAEAALDEAARLGTMAAHQAAQKEAIDQMAALRDLMHDKPFRRGPGAGLNIPASLTGAPGSSKSQGGYQSRPTTSTGGANAAPATTTTTQPANTTTSFAPTNPFATNPSTFSSNNPYHPSNLQRRNNTRPPSE